MNYFALLLPLLLIAGLIAGLVFLKRRLFTEDAPPAPIPIPELVNGPTIGRKQPPKLATSLPRHPSVDQDPGNGASARSADSGNNDLALSPSRLYPRRLLNPVQMAVFSKLLKALPGYVVLPKITYDHFLEARDGTASENTSLQNRAAQHLGDFIICDRKLHVLLVCQIEDGTQLPARILEREKMLQKCGLRLLRWNIEQPPDPASLFNMVQTLEKLATQTLKTEH